MFEKNELSISNGFTGSHMLIDWVKENYKRIPVKFAHYKIKWFATDIHDDVKRVIDVI